jgi:hypothetical protein
LAVLSGLFRTFSVGRKPTAQSGSPTKIPIAGKLPHAFALLAKLDQFGVIYTNLLGAFTNFAPLVKRSQFVLGNRVAKSLDPEAIVEFQEDEECGSAQSW